MLVATRPMIKTTWVLREVMARYKVKNKELAVALDRSETSISRIKTVDEMPELNGSELDNLCNALTKLLKSRGIDKTIYPSDLLTSEWVED